MKSWHLPLSVLAIGGFVACSQGPDEGPPAVDSTGTMALQMKGTVVTAAKQHVGELDVLRIALGKLGKGDNALLTLESPFGISLASMDLPVRELHGAMGAEVDATRVVDTDFQLHVPPELVTEGRFLANLYVCVDTDDDGMCGDELVDETLGVGGIGDAHVVAFVPLVAQIRGSRVVARRMRRGDDGYRGADAKLEQTLANYDPLSLGIEADGATVVLTGFAGNSAPPSQAEDGGAWYGDHEDEHDQPGNDDGPPDPDDWGGEPSDEPEGGPEGQWPDDEPGDEPGDQPPGDCAIHIPAGVEVVCDTCGIHALNPDIAEEYQWKCAPCSLELCQAILDTGDAQTHDNCMWQCGYAERTSGCFEIGTSIATGPGSTLPVERMMTGTPVMTADGRVLKVEKIVAGREDKALVQVQIDGAILGVTQDHPMVTESGIKAASEIDLGDKLVADGGRVSLVTALASTVTTRPVFNIVVEGDDSADHLIIAEGVVTGDLQVQQELAAKRSQVGP